MKTAATLIVLLAMFANAFAATIPVSMSSTNGKSFGELLVDNHIKATNTTTTNTFAGKFQQGQGTTANGTGAAAFGLGTKSSGSYGFSAGVGSVNAGPAAFASGSSNNITSSAPNSFASGNKNFALDQSTFVSGTSNNVAGSNSFVTGFDIIMESLSPNSFVGGQRITVESGSSNNFIWNGNPSTPLAITSDTTNSFVVEAEGGIILNGIRFPQDLPGTSVGAGTNIVTVTNGSLVTIHGQPRIYVAAGTNVTVLTNGALLTISSSGTGGAFATGSNATLIVIDESGPATPYPSSIVITNAPDPVDSMSVSIFGFNHNAPAEVILTLIGPGGQKVRLMDGCGSDAITSPAYVNASFSDSAANFVPAATITNGTYKPTVRTSAGTPSSPANGTYSTNLSVFNGVSPNGSWGLYAYDAVSLDGGFITNWSLTIATGSADFARLSFLENHFAGNIVADGTFTGDGSGLTNLPTSGSGVSSTNEIFSYVLSNAVAIGGTTIYLDRAFAPPATIAGHVAIGFGTTNCELRPAKTVSGNAVTWDRALTFAHAASERVLYFSSEQADSAFWGLIPNSSEDVGRGLLQAIYETSQEGLWFSGQGTFYTSWPLVSPPGGRIKNVTIRAATGYTGGGHTNAYFLWSSQGIRLPFTATAADDTITFGSSWAPPAGDATNSIVVFYGLGGTNLPAPLSNGIPYYVHAYSSTTMKVGLSTNVAEIVNITANGTGFTYTEVGAMERIYLEDVHLYGFGIPNANGIYASMQQPASWTGTVRVEYFGGIGVHIDGQQLDVNNLQIGRCGVGLDLRKRYGQAQGMLFLRMGTLNAEECTNFVHLGGGANIIGTVHLETPMSDTQADFDGTFETCSIIIKNFYASHGVRTNTVFAMGSSGDFASSYDIESGFVNSTSDADTLLLDDRYRNRKIFAYKSATGALRSFSDLESITVPGSISFNDLWSGKSLIGPDGRFAHFGMYYGPLAILQAGTNDSTPLFLPRRFDGTTNVFINQSGDFVSKSNAVAGYVLTSDADGVGIWGPSASGTATFTNTTTYGDAYRTNALHVNQSGILLTNASSTFQVSNGIVRARQLDIATNANPIIPDFTMGVNYFTTNAAFIFLPAAGVDVTKTLFQTTVCLVTNSSAAAVLVTHQTGVRVTGTSYVTNVSAFTYTQHAQYWTNCVCLPLW